MGLTGIRFRASNVIRYASFYSFGGNLMGMQQKKAWETPSVSSIGSIDQLTGFSSSSARGWGRGGWQNFTADLKKDGKNFCPPDIS